eukprot:scaffold3.g6541.t1
MARPLAPSLQEQPCFSGRLEEGTFTWRRHQRVRVACALGRQTGGRAPPPPTRAEAFAASLGVLGADAPGAPPAGAPPQLEDGPLPVGVDQRPAAGRKKPLKINLDLALVGDGRWVAWGWVLARGSPCRRHRLGPRLIACSPPAPPPQYRARQTRIAANRSPGAEERAALLAEAEAALRRCLAMDPEDGRAYVSLGKILVQQRRYDEAATLYEEGSTATGGTNAHIWTAWANLGARRGDALLARRLFDAAIVAVPAHAAAYHGWGLLERRQGNYLRARDLWARGIQATRQTPNAYLFQSLAAWALMEQRLGTEARIVRRLYARGLEVSPRSRYTYLSWALWEAGQGHVDEARRLYAQGAQLNPRDAAIFCAWAILEEQQACGGARGGEAERHGAGAGCIDEARQLFSRGARADPSHLYIWQAWGVLEYRQGRLEEARRLFQQGIWAAPPGVADVSLIFQAWAVLERAAGEVGVARQLFKCAVKADPKSEPSWLAWAAMEEDLGALERANELRNFSMQERQEIVRPANFTTLAPARGAGGALAPVIDKIASWFRAKDAAEGVGAAARPPPPPLASADAFGSDAASADEWGF